MAREILYGMQLHCSPAKTALRRILHASIFLLSHRFNGRTRSAPF